jgi:epoxide hydrolase-like predicted phosphatase
MRRFDAVLFDFNGVLTSSPFDHIGALGTDRGLSPDAVLDFMLGPYHDDTDHAWHRMERGEITIGEYATDLVARAEAAGLDLDFASLAGLMGRLDVHDVVVDRVRSLRTEGYRLGLVTNNVREVSKEWRQLVPVDELFDVVVDSSMVGMRKPNAAIYRYALDQLGVAEPGRAVFLDDCVGNVEGARRAGLHGILVTSPESAIAELDALLAST